MSTDRYKVKAGDTLSTVALRHHVSVSDLARANNIDDLDRRIQAGQLLKIPAHPPTVKPIASPGPRTHVVRISERLPDIARRHGLSVEEIMQANAIEDPRLLWIGQKLKLPSVQSAPQCESTARRVSNDGSASPDVSRQTNARSPSNAAPPATGFPITDIPTAMDGLQWKQAARVMRKWFNDEPYIMPHEVKLNRKDDRLLSKTHILDDLPFDWLLSSSARVKPVIDELVEEFAQVDEYNGRLGRVKGALDQLSPGLVQLMWRLEQLGLLDAKRRALINGSRFFGTLPAIQLEYTSQFNFVTVGTTLWEKATDKLDDVYGALGAFSIQMAMTQVTTETAHVGFPAITIHELGFYIRDTYEFRNEAGSRDQLLGYWGPKGVYRPGPWTYWRNPPSVEQGGATYSRITNDSFNDYRRLNKKGGDFVIYSTVKHVPTSISIHLNDADFMEYLSKRPKGR